MYSGGSISDTFTIGEKYRDNSFDFSYNFSDKFSAFFNYFYSKNIYYETVVSSNGTGTCTTNQEQKSISGKSFSLGIAFTIIPDLDSSLCYMISPAVEDYKSNNIYFDLSYVFGKNFRTLANFNVSITKHYYYLSFPIKYPKPHIEWEWKNLLNQTSLRNSDIGYNF